jgi:hypothetical protein
VFRKLEREAPVVDHEWVTKAPPPRERVGGRHGGASDEETEEREVAAALELMAVEGRVFGGRAPRSGFATPGSLARTAPVAFLGTESCLQRGSGVVCGKGLIQSNAGDGLTVAGDGRLVADRECGIGAVE